MLNSCSDPLVYTQGTTAYFKETQSLSIEMRSRLLSLLCFVPLQLDMPTVWRGLGCWGHGGMGK